MKVSEILRTLAELVAKSEGGDGAAQEVPHQDQRATLHNVEVDNTDHTDQTIMVTPLQQKLELMKKVAGVESAFDDEGCGDELDIMKKNAGLPAVAIVADGADLEG